MVIALLVAGPEGEVSSESNGLPHGEQQIEIYNAALRYIMTDDTSYAFVVGYKTRQKEWMAAIINQLHCPTVAWTGRHGETVSTLIADHRTRNNPAIIIVLGGPSTVRAAIQERVVHEFYIARMTTRSSVLPECQLISYPDPMLWSTPALIHSAIPSIAKVNTYLPATMLCYRPRPIVETSLASINVVESSYLLLVNNALRDRNVWMKSTINEEFRVYGPVTFVIDMQTHLTMPMLSVNPVKWDTVVSESIKTGIGSVITSSAMLSDDRSEETKNAIRNLTLNKQVMFVLREYNAIIYLTPNEESSTVICIASFQRGDIASEVPLGLAVMSLVSHFLAACAGM